jgi:hypothetical protein
LRIQDKTSFLDGAATRTDSSQDWSRGIPRTTGRAAFLARLVARHSSRGWSRGIPRAAGRAATSPLETGVHTTRDPMLNAVPTFQQKESRSVPSGISRKVQTGPLSTFNSGMDDHVD